MVKADYEDIFKRKFKKIKDNSLKEKIIKQVSKIKNNPNIGKPMKYSRKSTRELYVKPYRISYSYLRDKVIFLNFYHKDEQ